MELEVLDSYLVRSSSIRCTSSDSSSHHSTAADVRTGEESGVGKPRHDRTGHGYGPELDPAVAARTTRMERV